MVPFLTKNRTFSVLKLNNNGLGVTGGTIVANALLESAKLSKAEGKASNLRTVICGRNRLENGSAPFWAEAFKAHGGLVEVRMPQNGIRMEGVEALAGALSTCKSLQVFDLQDNTFTERGSRAVALALPSWPDLKTLNLSDCLLGPKGGISLATAFNKGTNSKLETLKLQYGELDHRSLNLIATAIQDHWPLLTTLELNGNRADPEDECITNIKDALETHGHSDALDELDDMEEYDEDAEANEDVEEEKESEDEVEEKPSTHPPAPATSQVSEALSKKLDEAADELADLFAKTSLGPPTAKE
jgi:Ran GTPase-activating protein 1